MEKLIWFDLETTGLDPESCRILEIAAYVADLSRPFDLTPLYEAVLWTPGPRGNDFVKEMHHRNGLWELCAKSNLFTVEVDDDLVEAMGEGEFYAAGSSIHFDVAFAKVHLPKFAAKLSHRMYDVSAVKLFARSVFCLSADAFPKGESHRAAADVMESVAHAKLCAEIMQGCR